MPPPVSVGVHNLHAKGHVSVEQDLRVSVIEEHVPNEGVLIDGLLIKDGMIASSGSIPDPLAVNTILERTSGNGVSIEGAVVKDGKLLVGEAAINTETAPNVELHVQSTGDATVWIEADTNNVTETDNPHLVFTQDGAMVRYDIGISGASNEWVFRASATPALSGASVWQFIAGETYSSSTPGTLPIVDGGAPVILFQIREDTGFVSLDPTMTLQADALQADAIVERTTNSGVTAEGVLVKDSYVQADNSNTAEASSNTNTFLRGNTSTASGWIALAAGPSSGGGDRVVMGHLSTNVGATLAAHNGALSAWASLHLGANIAGADTFLHGINVECDSANGFQTDLINERTSTAGVTIDGLLIKDTFIKSTNPNTGAMNTTILTRGSGSGSYYPAAAFGNNSGGGFITLGNHLGTQPAITAMDSALSGGTDMYINLSGGAKTIIGGGVQPVQMTGSAGLQVDCIDEYTTSAGVTIKSDLHVTGALTTNGISTASEDVLTVVGTALSLTTDWSRINVATGDTLPTLLTDPHFTLAVGTEGQRKSIMLDETFLNTDTATIQCATSQTTALHHETYYTLSNESNTLHLFFKNGNWEPWHGIEANEAVVHKDVHRLDGGTTQSIFWQGSMASDDGKRYGGVFDDHVLVVWRVDAHATVEEVRIDTTTGFFSTTVGGSDNVSSTMNNDIILVGSGATASAGEVAVLRRTPSTNAWVKDILIPNPSATTKFGWQPQISEVRADNTCTFIASSNLRTEIFELDLSAAVTTHSHTVTFTAALSAGSVKKVTALSADGLMMAHQVITGQISVYRNIAGTWTLQQSGLMSASSRLPVKFDFNANTMLVGDESAGASSNGSITRFKRDVITNQYSLEETFWTDEPNNAETGHESLFAMSFDGLKFTGITNRSGANWVVRTYQRADLNSNFETSQSVADQVFTENTFGSMSGDGSLLLITTVNVDWDDWWINAWKTKGTAKHTAPQFSRADDDNTLHGNLITDGSLSFDAGTNTLDTIVNATTWTVSPVLTANLSTTGSSEQYVKFSQIGDQVIGSFSITGLKEVAAATTCVMSFTVPVAHGISKGCIGSAGIQLTGTGWIAGAVVVIGGNASVRWEAMVGGSTTIQTLVVSLNYVIS